MKGAVSCVDVCLLDRNCFGGGCALYLLDRLGLWMERKGWLYYREKKSSVSSGNALMQNFMIEMQSFFEPDAKHVLQLNEENRQEAQAEDPLFGNGNPEPGPDLDDK